MKKVLVVKEGDKLPVYGSKSAAGCDVHAFIEIGDFGDNGPREILIESGQTRLIPTGIKAAIPEGYEIQVRPRSGLALKKSVTVLNTPGTIDSDYRGEIGIILINHSRQSFRVKNGDRIAQFVLNKVEQIKWEEVLELPETDRGDGGFGSTGVGSGTK
jgi:dUTP pyrophosphatase